MCELRAAQKLVVPRFQQIMIPMWTNEEKSTSEGTVEATSSVTRKAAPIVIPTIVELEKKSRQSFKWPNRLTIHTQSIQVRCWRTSQSWRRIKPKTSNACYWNKLPQSVHSRKSTSHDQTSVSQAHLHWRQKMVPNTRHVTSWHPQHTGQTNLRQD